MKSVVLVPYCPLPADTGGKVEMWKHLNVLRELGPCTILSANTKPVGCGWSAEALKEIRSLGFEVVLREEELPRRSVRQWLGILYAVVCKAFRLEKAFGHSNPYHRFAFPSDWWCRHTRGADVAVIHYSYWAWLPCACPKVIALLDIWSDYMWEGPHRETEELGKADLVVVISRDEEKKLNYRGIMRTLWSPPCIQRKDDCPLTSSIGCIGSSNAFNVEGLRWLEKSARGMTVRVYGSLSEEVVLPSFQPCGRYAENYTPYNECGIILLPTSGGMGVQIKVIEALACGRAIVARSGAFRGLPAGDPGWIEVASSEEMVDAAKQLEADEAFRAMWADRARAYYEEHLLAEDVLSRLSDAYLDIVKKHN